MNIIERKRETEAETETEIERKEGVSERTEWGWLSDSKDR